MKKLGFLLFVILISAISSFSQASEKDAVKVPLGYYLQGHITGDPDFIRKAFWPEGRVTFVREGKLVQRTAEEFAAGFPGKAAEDEAQRKRSIESIDITGNAATAKIVLDYPTVKFTDYMSLLKIDGEWRIINKSFNAEPKAAPAAKPKN